jgi:hypothetical protein
MPTYPVTHVDGRAHGVFSTGTRRIKILCGSIFSTNLNAEPASNAIQHYKGLKGLVKKGWVQPGHNGLNVVQDLPEVSPFAAKVMVDGKSGNGWTAWKLEDGRLLDILRQDGTCAPRRLVRQAVASGASPTIELDARDFTAHMEAIRDELLKDTCSRWLSWDHCHQFFREPANLAGQRCNAALHLGFFLANWGMFRNSQLLNKNHRFYEPIVDIIASPQAQALLDFPSNGMGDEEAVSSMTAVAGQIESYLRKSGISPTDTLITKILLATLACIPAIDQQARSGLRKLGVSCPGSHGLPDETALAGIIALVRKNLTILSDGCRVVTPQSPNQYPPMKILDMYLWRIGGNSNSNESRSDGID